MSTLDNVIEWLVPRLFAGIGVTARRVVPDDDSNLREWSPPPSPPPTPVQLHERGPSKYTKKGKRKKKTYKSRYDFDIDSIGEDEDEGSHVSSGHAQYQRNGFLYVMLCCGMSSSPLTTNPVSNKSREISSVVPFEDEPVRPKSKYDILREQMFSDEASNETGSLAHKFFGGEEEDEEVVDDEKTAGSNANEGVNGKKQLTEEEKAEIERRKAKQLKRLRKKVEKKEETEEFVERVVEEHDPLARYDVNFPPFGKLKGMPMSLDFLNSSHTKRAYDIVVARKTKRLQTMKNFVKNGGVDTIALNSGPEDNHVPPGFYISPSIPVLDSSFNGELAMILWEKEMNIDQFKHGDPALGWFIAKAHSHCNRPPYNFIMKYSKEVTGLRKLDGFVNTTLDPAGYHGYGRRWVWIRPLNSCTASNIPANDKSENSLIHKLLSSSNSVDSEQVSNDSDGCDVDR